MPVTKVGLTDLERAKYTLDSTTDISKVRVEPTAMPTTPLETYRFKIDYMTTTGGSADQNVDGSATAVDFVFTPSETVYVEHIMLVVVALNMISVLDYFNITGGLTNGILLFSKEGVTEYPFFNVKSTVELSHPSDTGFNNFRISGSQSEELMTSHIGFKFDGILSPTRSFGIRVRDNLTSIRYQRASVLYRTVT